MKAAVVERVSGRVSGRGSGAQGGPTGAPLFAEKVAACAISAVAAQYLWVAYLVSDVKRIEASWGIPDDDDVGVDPFWDYFNPLS
jgi:hypothetical protein